MGLFWFQNKWMMHSGLLECLMVCWLLATWGGICNELAGRQAPYGTERGAELEAYIPSIQGTITRPLNRVVSIPLGSRCRLFIIRPPSGRAQRAKTAPEPGTSDTVETAYKVTGYKVKSLINPFRVTLRRLLSKFAYKVDFLWYKWLLYKRFLLYR